MRKSTFEFHQERLSSNISTCHTVITGRHFRFSSAMSVCVKPTGLHTMETPLFGTNPQLWKCLMGDGMHSTDLLGLKDKLPMVCVI